MQIEVFKQLCLFGKNSKHIYLLNTPTKQKSVGVSTDITFNRSFFLLKIKNDKNK